jgi:hypothetical protein
LEEAFILMGDQHEARQSEADDFGRAVLGFVSESLWQLSDLGREISRHRQPGALEGHYERVLGNAAVYVIHGLDRHECGSYL